MIGFTVFYVQDCSFKRKYFKTRAAAQKFIEKFKYNDDNWVDCLVYGKIVETYEEN